MAPASFPLLPTSPASSIGPRSIDKDKEKGVNVQVLVRCRPFNEDELRANAPQVLSCNDQRREVSVNLNIAAKQVDRTFTFDKVFGPLAQQKDLYDQAIIPIVNEVLEGFNCTIFAYGQTGTGKTYTMEGGGRKTKGGEMPSEAGVIPRAVQQIVDTLESQNAEYSMKVTFLELYNEEITDLLAPEDLSRPLEDKQRKPLALLEVGKGGILVRGLEEEIVYSANEIYNLLERGSAKRRTAETLLNKQSSRSHSVFSITTHIKEATPEGEELIKCGKLNLVDLAGSENISRSGARDGRAREAGEINKSLLTLGRVITALVEHLGHIPYRDSKLTRLLRDSLGGRTKTCIIATVSPSVHCLEETLSTLDYAHRAKNIKNKPELNQKMMKSALIKDLHSEIDKLKAEIYASREKNGVYLPRDRYLQEEAEKKAMTERIELMEFEIEAKDKQLNDLQAALDLERHQCGDLSVKLENNQKRLEQSQDALAEAKERIRQAQYSIKERDFIISKLQQSENTLCEQAGSLQSQLETSVNDITGLHLKIDRKNEVEKGNHEVLQTFRGEVSQRLKALHSSVTTCVEQQQELLQNTEEHMKSFLANKEEVTEVLRGKVSSMKDKFCSNLKDLLGLVHSHEKDSTSTFEKLNCTVSAHGTALQEVLSTSVADADVVLQDLMRELFKQQDDISKFIHQQQERARQSRDASREISKTVVDFHGFLEQCAAEIRKDVLDTSENLHQNLMELEETYKEQSKREEQMLIEKITEMVAAATARKSEIVNSKISLLRESSRKDATNLQQDMLKICGATSETRCQWQTYIKLTENHFDEASASLSTSHQCLEDSLGQCVNITTKAGEGWKRKQESVQQLEKDYLLGIDVIVKEGIYENGVLLSNLERLNDSVQADVQIGNGVVMESIDCSFSIDKDAATTLLSTGTSQLDALTELQTCHSVGTGEIQIRSDQCFNREYLEDKPTCTTPEKRSIDVPAKSSIEALRAPCIENIVQEFRDKNSSVLLSTEKGGVTGQRGSKESKIPIFPESSLLKDNRAPLSTVN